MNLFLLQMLIPSTNFLPAPKAADQHIRRREQSADSVVTLDFFLFLDAHALEVRAFPGVNLATVFLACRRLDRLTLEFYFAFVRNTDYQLLVENNGTLDELIAVPKLSRSERFLYLPPSGIFQNVARFESFDRDMFFTQIAVHGSVARDIGSHILT